MSRRTPQDRTRKRFARRQWARRWLTWRYLLAAFLVVGGIGFAVYGVFFSPWLRVEGAEVTGTSQLTEETVLAVADVPDDVPLARVDLDEIAERVDDLDTVRSVDVSRQWPHEILIEVTERTPVAVVATSGGFTQLDAEGFRFGNLDKAPAGLPRVEVGSSAEPDALEEAALVVSSLTEEVAALVDHVEVETIDEILLELRDGRRVRWGSAEQSEEKAEVLLTLLQHDAQIYDVSVPGMPTTR